MIMIYVCVIFVFVALNVRNYVLRRCPKMSLLKIIHMYIITLIVTVNNNKNIIIETDHLRAISPGLEDSHTFNRQGRSVGERILKSYPLLNSI